jgi:hypothetical protein
MPSIDRVSKVYQQLKDIISIAVEQQAESSLERWPEFFISSLGHFKAS